MWGLFAGFARKQPPHMAPTTADPRETSKFNLVAQSSSWITVTKSASTASIRWLSDLNKLLSMVMLAYAISVVVSEAILPYRTSLT